MNFQEKEKALHLQHEALLTRKNEPLAHNNGIYKKYKFPILTAEHTPLEWRYDFSEKDNPYLMQRIMMNAVLNAGAIKWHDKYLLVCRVEGADRKSFFAVAESPNGIDNFRFWDEPITMPDDVIPATNIYDMRLTAHEDGWIYGIFCAERHDDAQSADPSAATATAAIARTHDFKTWERLPDLKTNSQQRNVVLHPEFVDGKYALYTRPQDGFIDTGSGGGIGWALVDDITHAEVRHERIIYPRQYHTIMEVKNGELQGDPEAINTWLQNTEVKTDNKGRFEIKNSGIPQEQVRLMVRDVDGKENGEHKSRMVEMEVTPADVDKSNAGGWNQGTFNKEVEIKLEDK